MFPSLKYEMCIVWFLDSLKKNVLMKGKEERKDENCQSPLALFYREMSCSYEIVGNALWNHRFAEDHRNDLLIRSHLSDDSRRIYFSMNFLYVQVSYNRLSIPRLLRDIFSFILLNKWRRDV